MTNQDIARLGAEALGLEYHMVNTCGKQYVERKKPLGRKFEPCNNANDMNLLIEHFKIDVRYYRNKWFCAYEIFGSPCETYCYESRDEAIKACVVKCLGVE